MGVVWEAYHKGMNGGYEGYPLWRSIRLPAAFAPLLVSIFSRLASGDQNLFQTDC